MTKYLLKNKWHLIFLCALIVIEPTLNSVLNLWLAKLFDSAQVGVELMLVIRLLLIGFTLWIVKRLVCFSGDVVKKNYLCNIRLALKNDIFRNALGTNVNDMLENGGSGEYTSLFINDVNIIEERYFAKIIDFVEYLVAVVVNGIAFVYLNSTLALAIMGFSIVVSFIPMFVSKGLNDSNFHYSEKVAKLTQKLKEFFTAFPTIKNYAVERGVLESFNEINYETEHSKFNAEYELNLANSIGAMLSWFTQIVAIGIGIVMIINGEVLVGTVIAARSFANDLATPLQGLLASINSLRSVNKIAKKIEQMTEGDNAYLNTDTSKSFEKPDITFNNVSLVANDNKIIDNFSFNFEYGKKYLIVGKNGAGKSTLFKLLKRMRNDYTGSVTLGGKDIATLTNGELACNVSYLNENVVMLSDGIKKNVKFFRDVTDEDVAVAVKRAQMNVDMTRTLLDQGSNISSGEQRRVEIARSMCAHPKVLIFDEVVSTLDIQTAYDIENLVLGYDETVIFISHNFSGKLIKKYDEILYLEDGSLKAHGSYETLIDTCEEFKHMCEIKFG